MKSPDVKDSVTTTDHSDGAATARDLQALLDATVDAVIIIDARGHVESFNRSGSDSSAMSPMK